MEIQENFKTKIYYILSTKRHIKMVEVGTSLSMICHLDL